MQYISRWVLILVSAVTLVYAAYKASCPPLTNENLTVQRPVIGVYTEPSPYSDYPSSQYSFIASSYVKYIESAGAQVVPILYDADETYYTKIFESVNGILFPGGNVDLVPGNKFTDNAAFLIKKAIQAKAEGVYFPIWGTCLGWELLNVVISDLPWYEVLTNVTDEIKVTHPINITQNGQLFEPMPEYLRNASQTQPLWYFNHQQCVTEQTYTQFPKLGEFFDILALAQNDDGFVFVAAGEAKEHPIYGTQFHPEKNNFEWRVPANHDLNAVMGSQYFANFFVQESRKNQHQFVTAEELQNALIYNYPTAVLPPSESPYSQVYILENWLSVKK